MAIVKNTTITGTGYLSSVSAPTASRTQPVTTIIQWTNTGSQGYSVLAGTTPTLTNTTWTCPTGVNNVEVLVVAGGGGGGSSGPTNAKYGGGGGGAGGLIYNAAFSVTPGTQYTVTVGAGGGGASGNTNGTSGSNSVFGSLTAIGGGGGGYDTGPTGSNGSSGGSGGGGAPAASSGSVGQGGAGTAGQGFSGGTNYGPSYNGGGGGGGAGSAGGPGRGNNGNKGGGGGIGLNFNITGTATWYAGGGGGGVFTSGHPGAGGLGGGGAGGALGSNGTNATASTGGGGGGASGNGSATVGGNGGSGIVIVRYNLLSDSTQPAGSVRYNSEVRALETNNITTGWTAQDPTRNFAGHNLITYSQIMGSGHSLSNVTVPTANNLAPDGTSTASFVAEDSTASAYHEFYASFTTASTTSGTYTYSIYAKAGTRTWIALRLGDSSTSSYSFINLSTGAIGTISGHTNVIVTSVGNGWYRCSVTRDTTLGAGSQYAGVRLATGDGTFIYSGQGSSYGVYLWGSQVELGSSASPYVYTNGVASPVPTNLNGYRTHTYTTVGTSGFTPSVSGLVEVLVVAGGGAGGGASNQAGQGGGGAGGLIYNTLYPVIAGQPYSVVVGAGGTANSSSQGGNGGNSQFGNIVAIGGGGGGGQASWANPGGSGGGCSYNSSAIGASVAGQGFPGGAGSGSNPYPGGGGGGAGGPGSSGVGSSAGSGGNGLLINISGTPTWYAGGGGGGSRTGGSNGAGGLGGGGQGALTSDTNGNAGTANTGGGGGGSSQASGTVTGGAGGTGIVIVRYRYD